MDPEDSASMNKNPPTTRIASIAIMRTSNKPSLDLIKRFTSNHPLEFGRS
jgi:hypothetical protein